LAQLETEGQEGVVAGTPAYMAPEQLAHGKTSVQSDLYALGLILYELFTGETAAKAASIPDLLRSHERSSLTASSRYPDAIDPIVERIISRCLAKNPTDRPNSIHAVAASLPGGDPLQAALAAGETPSPEMVAAAGETGGLKLLTGTVLLASICLVLAALPFVADWRDAFGASRLKTGKEPIVLKSAARELIDSLGFNEAPAVSVFGYSSNLDEERYFWYRQSSQPMLPRLSDFWDLPASWKVTTDNPSPFEPGMVSLQFDLEGRLQSLLAIPVAERREDLLDKEPNWDALLVAAGIDADDCEPIDDESPRSHRLPPLRVDLARRWRAQTSGDGPLEVLMAARDGRIVYFDRDASSGEGHSFGRSSLSTQRVANAFYVSLMIGFTGLLALRNLRLHRADTQGALRCSLYYFVVDLTLWIVAVPHLGSISASAIYGANYLIYSTAKAMRLWMFYVAVEPFIRRFWPDVLVSWSRILVGRLRDPLVGRDLLVGCLLGSSWALVTVATSSVEIPPGSIGTVKAIFAHVLNTHQWGLHAGMSLMAFLLLSRLLFRNTWLAAAAFVLVMTMIFHPPNAATDLTIRVVLVSATLAALYIRLGLVAAISTVISIVLLIGVVQTYDFEAWYSAGSKLTLTAVFAVSAFGFYTSTLAGQLSNANAR
jgi:serine/threonine-protein kinase